MLKLILNQKMLRKNNNKGFTLVEVIVVAVIVAVLALVAIQLYNGYVTESRLNTAQNLGASAASFLQSALNSDPAFIKPVGAGVTGTLTANLPSGESVTFTVPANATLDITATTVTATVSGQASAAYAYDLP